MPCFWVGDDVAYATLDEESIVGTYISTDENDRVTFGPDPRTGEPSRIPQFRREMVRCPQMSSIEYHEPTHKVLLTSREASHSCGLFVFSPVVEAGGSGERWLIGHASHYKRLSIRHSYGDEWIVHKCTPAPASSNLLCVVGTNGGVLRVNPNEDMEWIAPEVSPKGTKLPREIFDQDFQQSNHNVLLAGGRQPRLWITDLRTPDDEWTYIRHNSSIAHLRSVNPNQVLVAGLENQMSLYDMRYYSKRSDVARPLLKFAEYNNAAHFHTGWDVCTELGAVAAAQDDGTVKLFSLKTGRRVRSRVVDAVKTDTPVKALKFKTTEGEGMPSLWVGEGLTLRKLSFGVKEFGDEA
ncbi:hypothetical protein QQS21_007418 [Conoideocrella luteorostrata]|uniref:Uncharacterized protein n=1 Tax=Conoideocrella luteorostrata TaxID=1105319 RepID=A0AAJ0FS29_9HYPO|nr:hypothetical protein QQS21_007418 [Conoideocrella luteorostrata]